MSLNKRRGTTTREPVPERYSQLQKLNALLIVELLRQWAAVTAHDFLGRTPGESVHRSAQLGIINKAAKRVLVNINKG